MNKSIILKITIASGLSFFIVGGTISAILHKKTTEQVYAYNALSDLPTTIDLNDSSASEIRNYYSSLNGKSASELKGNNLLKNLKPILKNNQKYYSYDYTPSGTSTSGLPIWQIYEIVDRDWEMSPASSTQYGTYNSSTNKITNYQYGTGNNSNYSKNNPYLHALYVNRDVTTQVKAWGNHTGDEWGINREHVWAKSHGMGSTDTSSNSGGARGDLMHLWSGNQYVNKYIHSNYFFGFVDKTLSYTDAGSSYSHLSGNLKGYSASLGGDDYIFEPQDSDKGDIARIIFYMAARYNYISGSDSDGIDANNPWLTVYDGISDPNGSSTYDSTSSKQGYMGIIRDLLAWNRLDPPDEWEIHRNNLLFKNYTNNRNPFIDFPEWAEYIWGTSELSNDNRKVISYSNTSTGSANPSSDTLNGFKTVNVPVAGVTLSPSSLTMTVGQSQQLTPTISPSNASNKNVAWTSSNTSKVEVNDSGVLNAKATGNATITVRTVDGNFTATCSVTVNAAPAVNYTFTSGSPFINGLAYKLYYYSTSVGSNLYFTGVTSGYYGAVSNSISEAADVFFEQSGSGQNIYCNATGSKQYLSVYKNGNYYNYKYDTEEPSEKWTYSSTYECMTINAEGTICTLGSYSTNQRLAGHSLTQYPNNYRMTFISSGNDGPTAFSQAFLASMTCNPNGTSAPTFSTGVDWNLYQLSYGKLDSNSQNTLKNTSGNQYGSTTEHAMARYDLLCQKYSYTNFINRASANASNSAFLPFHQDRSLILAFSLAFTVISLGAVVLITLKKKKVI